MQNRIIAIIAAVARNRVIGAGSGLPWHLPEDTRHFKLLTDGHTVIMGRRTWDSIGRPLKRRQAIVLSSDAISSEGSPETATSLGHALQMATLPDPVFVIGGSSLYRSALDVASLMYLTEIQADFDGDIYFPEVDMRKWNEVSRVRRIGSISYDFVEYRRSSSRNSN